MAMFVKIGNPVNFAELLSSDDLRKHLTAVAFLLGEKEHREVFLPRLLEICRTMDFQKESKSKQEQSFRIMAARAMGQIINRVGFDDRKELHTGCVRWFDELTQTQEMDSVFSGIWGFTDLGVPPEKTIERLHEIATGGRLNREPPQISARGMAFRSIAKLDRTLAETLVDYECCREYLQGIEHWLAESEPNSKIYNELLDEARWLRRD
jgi:hypothetical protein